MFSTCEYVSKYVLQLYYFYGVLYCTSTHFVICQMLKVSHLSLSDVIFQAPNAPKSIFCWASALSPTGGAYNAGSLQCSPWLPSWLGRGYPLLIPFPLDAFGVLILSPSKQNSWLRLWSVCFSVRLHFHYCIWFLFKRLTFKC